MDVLPSPPDRALELDELRRRAYGPDADIHEDAEALDRLRRLESEERGSVAVDSVLDERVGDEVPGSDLDGGDAGATEDAASVPHANPEAPPNRRSRRTLWLVGVVALVIGVAIGAAAVISLQPRPDFVLVSQPIESEDVERLIENFGFAGGEPEEVVWYGEIGGKSVWSSEAPDGQTCVFVTGPLQDYAGAGCGSAGFDAIADVPPGSEYVIDDPRIPANSSVRFVLTDAGVEVWTRPTPASLESLLPVD